MLAEVINRKTLYLIPLLLILTSDQLFIPLDPLKYPILFEGISMFLKIVLFVALVYTLFKFRKLKIPLLLFFGTALCFIIYLIFESLYLYHSFAQYPHVFSKLLKLVTVSAFYIFYLQYREANFYVLINIFIIALFVNIALNPQMISIRSFVDHERGISSGSAFLLLVPCFVFLAKYFVEGTKDSLIKFLVLIFLILLFNHRTVWASAIIGIVSLMILLREKVFLSITSLFSVLLPLSLIALFSLLLILTYNPKVGEKINENISAIVNPQEDVYGTADWRIRQIESYWPYASKNIMFGMRLKGFELPNQFFNQESGDANFADATGHHFHSFYFDILFYFGLIGLLLFIFMLSYPVFSFSQDMINSPILVGLFAFVVSALVYALANNLPYFFWPILGYFLAQKEQFSEN